MQYVFGDGQRVCLWCRGGGTVASEDIYTSRSDSLKCANEISRVIERKKLAEAHRLAKCHSIRALILILASWDVPCQAAISQAANYENAVLFRTVQCMEDLQDAVFGFRHFVFFSFSFTCQDVESQHLVEYISTCGYMLEGIMQHLGRMHTYVKAHNCDCPCDWVSITDTFAHGSDNIGDDSMAVAKAKSQPCIDLIHDMVDEALHCVSKSSEFDKNQQQQLFSKVRAVQLSLNSALCVPAQCHKLCVEYKLKYNQCSKIKVEDAKSMGIFQMLPTEIITECFMVAWSSKVQQELHLNDQELACQMITCQMIRAVYGHYVASQMKKLRSMLAIYETDIEQLALATAPRHLSSRLADFAEQNQFD